MYKKKRQEAGKLVMKKEWKKIGALALAAGMALSLAACGKVDSSKEEQKKEWAYVPEFFTVEGEGADYYAMQLVGEAFYYMSYEWNEATGSSHGICKYSLADRKVTKIPLKMAQDGNQNLNRGSFAADGSMCAILYTYSEDYSEQEIALTKFDAEGNQIFSKKLDDISENTYIDITVADGQGRLYLNVDGKILLYDAEGNGKGSIQVANAGNTWFNNLVCGRDGKVYVSCSSYDGKNSTHTLYELDFDGAKLGKAYENVPQGGILAAGKEYDFLMSDGMAVYGYDLAKQEKTHLFDWLDSDINGNSVRSFGQLEDGRIVVTIEDWENNDSGLALLTKKKAEEVPQKENILIGTLSGSYALQSEAVKFNRASSKYHVSVKQYVDYDNYGENTWADAVANLNNDLTSTTNCPDLLDLEGVRTAQLAAKGVFEDLGPWLEKSNVVSRSDYLENILNTYTFDGLLAAVPTHFYMTTVIGSTAMVGSESGWTLGEMMELADKYLDAELFDRVSKTSILQAALMFNEDSFVNWQTGECTFDSDAFKNLLKFVGRFPDEVNYESGQDSEPTRIQNGEVLLAQGYLNDFTSIQQYGGFFKDGYTCIGFPTVDGKGGHALYASSAYAITGKSKQKEGAWEFLESVLSEKENEDHWGGFPTRKADLDAMIEKATVVQYLKDENGEIMKDENGDPIVENDMASSTMSYEDGWSYTYHQPTREEVDQVLALMEEAKPVSYNNNDEIMEIISEEAPAFFKGQKSADDVAGIIQNRVNNYVGETR